VVSTPGNYKANRLKFRICMFGASSWRRSLRLREIFGSVTRYASLLGMEGVDVNKADKYDQTPLWVAVRLGKVKVIKLLQRMTH
jgi:ankyrin repeat protein